MTPNKKIVTLQCDGLPESAAETVTMSNTKADFLQQLLREFANTEHSIKVAIEAVAQCRDLDKLA